MLDQDDLFSPRARWDDPDTSAAAAASVLTLTAKRAAVLELLRDYPNGLTDEQLAERYERRVLPPQSPSGLRTRRSELVRAGLVEDTGMRVRMSTGRMAIVWKVAA